MNRASLLLALSLLVATPCHALSKGEVRAIIEAAYPGAHITEIERETWKGQKIYEVDFRHEGRKLEGIISVVVLDEQVRGAPSRRLRRVAKTAQAADFSIFIARRICYSRVRLRAFPGQDSGGFRSLER